MATTTNYGWTTPDNTDLVKDGASAIRTLGSSIDTTVKALSPGTTSGDLDYYTSGTAKARLGIGTTGQVLTVSGGLPAWAAAPASGANWSLLNTGGTALTGAQTITISGISAKDKIMVLIDQASASGNSAISVRLNTDTGANYNSLGYEITVTASYVMNNFAGTSQLSSTGIKLGILASTTASTLSGYASFTGCNSAGVKAFQAVGGVFNNATANSTSYSLGGFYNSATTISSVSLFSDTGNFDAGTVYVYTSA